MSSSTTKKQKTPAIKPRRTIQIGEYTGAVRCVVHLPGRLGRRIITCSDSLRLWNLDSGAQIGDNWQDRGDEEHVYTIALSPNGKTIAAGSSDGVVRLWDIETGKVLVRLTGHDLIVWSVCWSTDGEHVVSGSADGTARVWHAESHKTVLGPIKTGHEFVYAVVNSPDRTKIATGGANENGIKIWDSKTGELLTTIEHKDSVFSLAWTSDQKKLISGSGDGSIRIFNTKWQEIAILEGHQTVVYAISLFHNDRFVASASWDRTARLWNLDTNLQVGPPLQHEDSVNGAAISADGKLLVTGCEDESAQVWGIHTILKDAGLEDLLSIPNKVSSGKPFMDTDATTRRSALLENTNRLPGGFFDEQEGVHSSTMRVTHPRSSARHRRVSARSSTSRPYAFLSRLASIVQRSQPTITESAELQQRSRQSNSHHGPRVVEIAAVRDKQALFVARRPERLSDKAKRIKNPSRWNRFILFICCISVPDTSDPSHQ